MKNKPVRVKNEHLVLIVFIFFFLVGTLYGKNARAGIRHGKSCISLTCCGEGLRILGKDSELRLSGRIFTQVLVFRQTDFRDEEGIDSRFSIREALIEVFVRWKTIGAFIQAELDPFSASVRNAYLEWKPGKWFVIRAGRDYIPFGLSQGIDLPENPFFERPLFTGNIKDLRDIGLWMRGELVPDTLFYAAGIFNGSRDIMPEENEKPDMAARIVLEPFGLLGTSRPGIFHMGASFRWGTGPSHQGFRGKMPSGYSFLKPPEVEGEVWGSAAEIAWWRSRFGVFAEFQHLQMERKNISYTDPETLTTYTDPGSLEINGYCVGGSVLVYGKPGIKRANFPPSTGPRPLKGIELAARFEELWIRDGKGPQDPLEESHVMSLTAGLNAFLARHIIIQAQYMFSYFDPSSIAPAADSRYSHIGVLRAGVVF